MKGEVKQDCCSVSGPAPNALSRCQVCGRAGHKVHRLTLEHLLRATRLPDIVDGQYHFCSTPTCDVVYFNNEHDSQFRKHDLLVRVGLKETDDPIPVCYCFGYTRKMILDEVEQRGHSTVTERIKAEVKAENCACEIKNPSGRCCLGDVAGIVRRRTSPDQREVLATIERFSQASNEYA